MESANLSFRQINLTALSHTPNFKARYKPHYQMRKAIGKKKKKKKRMGEKCRGHHNGAREGLRLQSSFTDGTGGGK